MAVGGITSAGEKNTAPKRPAPDSSTLQMEDFMKLLSVQMQNQDMNNPMSNTEMMGQLTSMATVQAMNTFSELSSTQYAVSLIGKDVQVTDIDPVTNKMEMKSGVVSGINLSNMTFFLKDHTKAYGLGNVMEIGTIKKDPNDVDADGRPDDEDGNKPPKPPVDGNTPNPPAGGDNENKPNPPAGGDNENKPNPPADDNKAKSASSGGSKTGPDGRAAAPSVKAASTGNEAPKSGIATLPDGRASTPVGRTAEASGRTVSDNKTTASGRSAAEDRSTPADSGTVAANSQTESSRAMTGGRAAATGSRSESGSNRTPAPGRREDTPGMAQDKIDALAEQASRTIPADKAASLERDRLYRSSVSHIGPGTWA